VVILVVAVRNPVGGMACELRDLHSDRMATSYRSHGTGPQVRFSIEDKSVVSCASALIGALVVDGAICGGRCCDDRGRSRIGSAISPVPTVTVCLDSVILTICRSTPGISLCHRDEYEGDMGDIAPVYCW
jgi:hypothetical protein